MVVVGFDFCNGWQSTNKTFCDDSSASCDPFIEIGWGSGLFLFTVRADSAGFLFSSITLREYMHHAYFRAKMCTLHIFAACFWDERHAPPELLFR